MQELSVWVRAGLVTVGVSAALLAGAGAAGADDGTGSKSGGGNSGSAGASSGASKSSAKSSAKSSERDTAKGTSATKTTSATTKNRPRTRATSTDTDTDPEAPATAEPNKKSTAAESAVADATEVEDPALATPATLATKAPAAADTKVVKTASALAESAPSPARAKLSAAAAPALPSALGLVGSVIEAVGAIGANVGSIALTALQAVEALVAGPPVLPPGSTVTVRSSSITLSNGQRVAANWYYPEGDEPPDQMVLLQHGFLALGPMYSYTAANLAESTHSIVVTPSLPSNLFAGDDYWLGGTGMASAIADLFVGDRAALTRSALDAGFATRYGLDPQTAALPAKFALSGHSLGGNLVSGAAGFLAENGAAADLVGVILLDGVPLGSTLPDALVKLDAYEAAGGQYIPIRVIGAPLNPLNSLSNANESLSAARPDRFNGVVLEGGVHMDSMRGGNPLIQFSAYLAAGFPQPQNPPAVDELAATWLGDWFAGQTDVGDDLVPGSTIDVPTPEGLARGVVIGLPPTTAATPLRSLVVSPSEPTTIPKVNPKLATLSA